MCWNSKERLNAWVESNLGECHVYAISYSYTHQFLSTVPSDIYLFWKAVGLLSDFFASNGHLYLWPFLTIRMCLQQLIRRTCRVNSKLPLFPIIRIHSWLVIVQLCDFDYWGNIAQLSCIISNSFMNRLGSLNGVTCLSLPWIVIPTGQNLLHHCRSDVNATLEKVVLYYC